MLVTFETAKLAKERGSDIETIYHYEGKPQCLYKNIQNPTHIITPAPTQSELQKFIREKRGVHIEIHRNASGYYWSMCKSDGGTDLGWSDDVGPNDGGVWDTFEEALEHGLQVQLSFDLPDNTSVIKHWGNYVMFALSKFKKE